MSGVFDNINVAAVLALLFFVLNQPPGEVSKRS